MIRFPQALQCGRPLKSPSDVRVRVKFVEGDCGGEVRARIARTMLPRRPLFRRQCQRQARLAPANRISRASLLAIEFHANSRRNKCPCFNR